MLAEPRRPRVKVKTWDLSSCRAQNTTAHKVDLGQNRKTPRFWDLQLGHLLRSAKSEAFSSAPILPKIPVPSPGKHDKPTCFNLSNHNSHRQSAAAVQSSARGTSPPHVSLEELEELATSTAILVLALVEHALVETNELCSPRMPRGGGAQAARPRPLCAL